MKKSFSILGSFCLGLFISVAVIACAVDEEYGGGNNPSATTPKNEPVAYIDGIINEGDYRAMGDLEATYDNNGIITGWSTYWQEDLQVSVSIDSMNPNVLRVSPVDPRIGVKGYKCNCDLMELRSNHKDQYNAIVSQVMMSWYEQQNMLALMLKYFKRN